MTALDRPLLHICHAPGDRAWVHGRLIPELGVQCGQYTTPADGELGELHTRAIELAVERCRHTLIVASSAARLDQATQLAARLAQQLGLEGRARPLIVLALGAAAASDRAGWVAEAGGSAAELP